MQTITTMGLDSAKSVFQVHGVDAAGRGVIRRQLKRRVALAFLEKLPSCLIGIEACASSHHWSRELRALGYTVRCVRRMWRDDCRIWPKSPRRGQRPALVTPAARRRLGGKARCRMHGGASGSGGPASGRNGDFRHGRYTKENQKMAQVRSLLREAKALTKSLAVRSQVANAA